MLFLRGPSKPWHGNKPEGLCRRGSDTSSTQLGVAQGAEQHFPSLSPLTRVHLASLDEMLFLERQEGWEKQKPPAPMRGCWEKSVLSGCWPFPGPSPRLAFQIDAADPHTPSATPTPLLYMKHQNYLKIPPLSPHPGSKTLPNLHPPGDPPSM